MFVQNQTKEREKTKKKKMKKKKMRDRDFGWTEEVWMDRVRVMLGFGLRTSYVMFFYCHYYRYGTG